MSFAALALRARAANDTTRAQINNIPSKSHVIPLLRLKVINKALFAVVLLFSKIHFLRPGQTINVGRPNLLGEPTFYRLATVFDDHSTCLMMLEHV